MNAHKTSPAEACRRFEPLLARLDQADLASVQDVTCGVFADDLMIGYVNPAWSAFARANGATTMWGPGDYLLDAISEPLRSFYAARFTRVLAAGEPWEHDYECSSPQVHREFRLRALPLADGAGLLFTHSLRVERAHSLHSQPEGASRHRNAAGQITQCAHCRRVRDAGPPPQWDWVPALLAPSTPDVTHGLCELCSAYYFGPQALSA